MKGYVLMKKMIVLLAAVVMTFVVTGCRSVFTSDGASAIPQISADHPGYAAVYSHKNVRVNGEAQVNVLLGILSWGTEGYADNANFSLFSFFPSAENVAKRAAVYEACQKNNADTLLGTRYVLTVTDYLIFKTINCKVAGFPATMDNVKKKSPYVLPSGKLVWMAEKPTVIK